MECLLFFTKKQNSGSYSSCNDDLAANFQVNMYDYSGYNDHYKYSFTEYSWVDRIL